MTTSRGLTAGRGRERPAPSPRPASAAVTDPLTSGSDPWSPILLSHQSDISLALAPRFVRLRYGGRKDLIVQRRIVAFPPTCPAPHLLPTAHSGPQAQSPHPPAPPCSGVRGLSTPGDPPPLPPSTPLRGAGRAFSLEGRPGRLPPRLASGSRHSPSRPALAFSVFHISSLKTSLKSPRVPHRVERKPQAPRGPGRPCRPPPGVGPSSSRCSADLGVRA